MRTDRRLTFKRKLAYVAVASCFTAMPAFANPTGAIVVNGQAGFAVQGNALTITNTPSAIINWQQFSIGPGEITRFVQQSASSAVLNRVLGQDPSQILGSLLSNGRVFLVNPNGIVFGQGAVIDVAGLVASTLRLSDGDFLAGKLNFTNGAGAGGIDNQGTITAPNGGNIYLIAPDIRNSGLITSPQGEILLAAGHSVNLMDAANPDVQVTLSAPDTRAVNIGTLMAQSGRIGIYGALIDQQGTANADTAILGANGRIMLRASKDITLEPGSLTTASGLGGGVRDGGEIRIVADGTLAMRQGSEVHVDGGADGGNGGFLELSGKQKISLNGVYTGRARKDGFRGGELLLDPFDIVICADPLSCTGSTGGASPIMLSTGTILHSSSPSSTLYLHPNMNGVSGSPAWSNVSLAALRDITVASAITDADVAPGGSLTMNAGNNITVAANIGSSAGTIESPRFNHDLTMQAGNDVNINASIYMGNNTLLVRSGASSAQLGFSPSACSPCGRSISITPTAASSVTVDILGGIELYAPSGGAVNVTGGSASNQNASVTVHGGTVTINAGAVTIQGGSASASGDTASPNADVSARVLADGAMSVTTTSGGLTIRGGTAAAGAACCSSGASVSATADATLTAGALTLTLANGLLVQGGNATANAAGSWSGVVYTATASAKAAIQVTGNLELTNGAGVRVAAVQISGGSASAFAYGTSGSGNAKAYANATMTAGSLTLRADSLTVKGGSNSVVVHAQVGTSASGATNRSATAEGKALLQVNGSISVMDIGSGGLAVSGGTGGGPATALVTGAGGTNSAIADRSASIVVTGDVTSLTVAGGNLTVQGGSASASANGLGSNVATENANAGITVTGAMTLSIGGGLSMANGSARASGSGAAASADASVSAGSTMTVTADVMDIGGTLTSTGGMTLAPFTASYGIDLGTEMAGQLSLTALELGNISAAQLTVGSGTAGAIVVSDSFTRSEPLSLVSGADITLNSGLAITSAATGNAVVLAAGGNFINNAGSGAISLTGGGRWLVYSVNPASNTFGNFDSGNSAIWNTTYAVTPPASVTQTGNRYLFSFQPTLTFTSTSASKAYGTDAAAALASAYSMSGLNAGIANAYLADTSTTAFSGLPSVTSAGSASSAAVSGSPYAVTIAQGSLSPLNGYALAFASSGLLTVNPLAVTLTGSKTYDGSAAFSAGQLGIGNLVGSDIVSLSAGTASTADANAGLDKPFVSFTGLSLTGAAAGNYTLSGVSGTSMIDPLAITLTGSKAYDGNAAFSAGQLGIGNLVGSDNVSLLAGTASTADANAGLDKPFVSFTGLALTGASAGNYTLTGVSGAATITAAAPVQPTVIDNPDVAAALDFGNEETNDSVNVEEIAPAAQVVVEQGEEEEEDEIPVCN